MAADSEEQNREDKRDRADLEKAEHEQIPAGRLGDSFSQRIITAPPKLMISQAIRKPAPSRKPKTPSAPIRLMAAPNSQPAWPCTRRGRQRAGKRRRHQAETEKP